MLSCHGFIRKKFFHKSTFVCPLGMVQFMEHLLEVERSHPPTSRSSLTVAEKEDFPFSCSANYNPNSLQTTCINMILFPL